VAKWNAVHHTAVGQETHLHQAPHRHEPVRLGLRYLRGRGQYKAMGAAGVIRTQVRGKHHTSHQSGYSLLCRENAALLQYCGAYSRRGRHRRR